MTQKWKTNFQKEKQNKAQNMFTTDVMKMKCKYMNFQELTQT